MEQKESRIVRAKRKTPSDTGAREGDQAGKSRQAARI
jgi:hypothetical protein